MSSLLSYFEIFKGPMYASDDQKIDYVDFEKEVNILFPISSSFDEHIAQRQFNLWKLQKKEFSQNFQDPVGIYLKVFISPNKINSPLFHYKCLVKSYDELQMEIEIDDPNLGKEL
jgi:hypothetical protein